MGVYSYDDFCEYHQPYYWWGGPWSTPTPLSVVQLIQSASMDASLAALLWLMLKHRASIVVAAQAPLSGKSTTLTALLDFLPAASERFYLRGMAETFEFVGRSRPERSYLLCNEISPDLPTYIWGRPAAMVFQLLGEGYALGSTMHADSPEKIVAILERELGVPRTLVARLTLVLVLDKHWSPARRRIDVRSLHLIQPDANGGLDIQTLAERTAGGLEHDPLPALRLLEKLGVTRQRSRRELAARRRFLENLGDAGINSVADVRAAVGAYPAEAGALVVS